MTQFVSPGNNTQKLLVATVAATATIPASKKRSTDTVKVNDESVRGQRSHNRHLDTITKQKLDDDSVGCPCCQKPITADTDCIKCDSCLNMFHQECTGLSNDVFKV